MNKDCQQVVGPCTCGTWHKEGEFPMTNVLQFKKKISEITNVILLGEVGVEVVFTSVPLEQQLTCGEKQSDSFLQEKFREVLKKNKLNADKLRAERAQANRNVTKSYRLKK